ncbi:MAG: ABC transporter substrate-binding protein [Hyphomicrobiaceae bacterium]|nr:ABC transporter substrate-binding protein [Hyphomicrobiaceae bacterium]
MVAAAAFWSATGDAMAGKANDTLVVAFQRGILSADYTFNTKREDIIHSELIDDGLFYIPPDTLKPVPLAAKSAKWIDDTTLDVTIREGIKFHDGSPLTADDVVYTYQWTLNPKGKTRRHKQYKVWIKSVEKIGPLVVRFKLKAPYPLAETSLGRSVPLRKKGAFDAIAKTGEEPRILEINGIGPYRLVKLEPGKQSVYERFEGYYKGSPKGRPAIKTIIIRGIPDWGTQQAEVMRGGIDVMYAVPTDVAESVAATRRAVHTSGPTMRVGFLVIDAMGRSGKDHPLTKLDVRRAMMHAINREAIVKYMVKGRAKVIHAACHPAQFGCPTDVRKYEYNPAKAKALLKAAGYGSGANIDIWAYREKEVAEAIAADLTTVGFKVNLRYVKLTALNKARKDGKIQAYFGTWGSGGVADASAIATRHWLPNDDRNMSGDPKVSEYIVGAERTNDPAKRKALYDNGFKLIAEQVYWAPLYAFTMNYITSTDTAFVAPEDGLLRPYLMKWK